MWVATKYIEQLPDSTPRTDLDIGLGPLEELWVDGKVAKGEGPVHCPQTRQGEINQRAPQTPGGVHRDVNAPAHERGWGARLRVRVDTRVSWCLVAMRIGASCSRLISTPSPRPHTGNTRSNQ